MNFNIFHFIFLLFVLIAVHRKILQCNIVTFCFTFDFIVVPLGLASPPAYSTINEQVPDTSQKKTKNIPVKLDLTLGNSNATHKKITIDNRIIKG